MISVLEGDPGLTDALAQWQARRPLPTALGSVDLRRLGAELHLRSITSARMTNLNYLEYVAEVVDDALSGKINLATARLRLMRKLAELGYDPAVGFPEEWGRVPHAERGSMQDHSSALRIDLLLKTNLAVARNYGRMTAGNTDEARFLWPAWELVRLGWREVERGTPQSHSPGWQRRWDQAGASVEWAGVAGGDPAPRVPEPPHGTRGAASLPGAPMIALKDSPLWQALGDGAGGDYSDTLGHPFPPFAFNSGMDWRAVPRAECVQLGLIAGGESPAPMQGELGTLASEMQAVMRRLGPDFRAEMMRELREEAAR